MRRLVDTEEAARILGITPRAIRKKFSKGKIKGEFVNSHKGYGKAGQVLKVYIDDESSGSGVRLPAGQAGSPELKPNPKNRYKIGGGEPGCSVMTPIENGMPISPSPLPSPPGGEGIIGGDSSARGEGVIFQTLPSGLDNLASPNQTPPSPDGGVLLNLPAIRGSTLPTAAPKLEHEGYLRLAILNAWRSKISENHKPKGDTTVEFLACYNSGLLLPYIYDTIGTISRATLYNWDRAEKLGGPSGLTPQYRGHDPSPITDYEQYILLNCLLHQNRLKIGTAIKFTKTFLTYKKLPSPSSESKLRRFADDFKRTRYDAWVKAREGSKVLNDKCLPYAERNWRFLTVGEGLVADGHRLNFQVVHPFTGKPCRATIVLFWDWKSAYPCGWEIMLEENIQCIASALRNAILTLGKIPKWLLVDNGKAFKAKAFTSEVELEDGILYGMFATLGIHTHFSQAYNPQEKPLERFWGTFNNWFERLWGSYSGASINDKPAYMLRNEKDAQARQDKHIPKIEEVNDNLLKFRQFYAGQPSRGRAGKTPGEIFEAEKGPGVDPAQLYHLMMVKEMRLVHRQGITWNGWHYYHEKFYGLRDYVLVKYSLWDYSQLHCFYKGRFLCTATPIEQSHPMASEAEFPKDHEAHKRIGAFKSKARRSTKNLLTLIESGGPIDAERDFRRTPEIADVIQAIQDKTKPEPPITSAFAEDPIVEAEVIPTVHPKTGRTVPMLNEEYEIYEWYRKQDVSALNECDREWIREYQASEEWKEFYSNKTRIAV